MNGFTYDTGALVAAEARRDDVWALHKRVLNRGLSPIVPAVVLAQAWRGGPQPLLSQFLRGCVVEAFIETRARGVGVALARSETNDIVDAAVVISALGRGGTVVTSDPDDLRRVAERLGAKLQLHVV
ncbi:MAG: twitching motility protein PilT [Candidatus Dormibacteraceae bacterium]